MTKTEAIKAAASGETVELKDRTPTGLYCRHAVWLDDDGELVRSHPTDHARGPIAAPECDSYVIWRDPPALT
jgi:hypothetical protein